MFHSIPFHLFCLIVLFLWHILIPLTPHRAPCSIFLSHCINFSFVLSVIRSFVRSFVYSLFSFFFFSLLFMGIAEPFILLWKWKFIQTIWYNILGGFLLRTPHNATIMCGITSVKIIAKRRQITGELLQIDYSHWINIFVWFIQSVHLCVRLSLFSIYAISCVCFSVYLLFIDSYFFLLPLKRNQILNIIY